MDVNHDAQHIENRDLTFRFQSDLDLLSVLLKNLHPRVSGQVLA